MEGISFLCHGIAAHVRKLCKRYLASRGEGGDIFCDQQIVFSSLVCGLGVSVLNNVCENMDLQRLRYTFHQKANDLYKQLDQLEQQGLSQTVQFVRKVHADYFDICYDQMKMCLTSQ